jgi:hypothetical protein
MPINIKVLYDKENSRVDIRLVKLFNLRLSIGKVLKYLVTTKGHREEVTLDSIIYNISVFMKSRAIINEVAKMARVKKITINSGLDYEKYILVVNAWIAVDRMNRFLKKMFNRVENEYYMISHSEKPYLAVELIVEVRIIFLLLAIIIKIKDLFKVMKFMRLYYGKSNI